MFHQNSLHNFSATAAGREESSQMVGTTVLSLEMQMLDDEEDGRQDLPTAWVLGDSLGGTDGLSSHLLYSYLMIL